MLVDFELTRKLLHSTIALLGHWAMISRLTRLLTMAIGLKAYRTMSRLIPLSNCFEARDMSNATTAV